MKSSQFEAEQAEAKLQQAEAELQQAETELQQAWERHVAARKAGDEDFVLMTKKAWETYSRLAARARAKRDSFFDKRQDLSSDGLNALCAEVLPTELVTEFTQEFQKTTNISLDEQRQEFGNALKARFHPFLDSDNIFLDSYLLKPVGDVHLQLKDVLDVQQGERGQQRKIVGIVQVSGGGKTKLYFSLGEHTDYDVVFIRLLDGGETPQFQSLVNHVKKASIEPLDLVRLFVASHFIWLLGVSEKCGSQPGHQGLLWLYALRDHLGQHAVSTVFQNLVLRAQEDSSNLVQFTLALMCHLSQKMRFQSGWKILVAFDEITAAQDQKDLYYWIQKHMLELLDDIFTVAMSDTTSSIFEVVAYDRSPLHSKLAEFTRFHSITKAEMAEFIGTLFETTDEFLQNLTEALSVFEGRPHFFFITFRQELMGACHRKKPKDAAEFAALLNQQFINDCFEKCVSNVGRIIARKWVPSGAVPAVSASPTVAQDLHMLFAAHVLRSSVKVFRASSVEHLVKTGVLFQRERSTTIELNEPVVQAALLRHGLEELRGGFDPVLEVFSRLSRLAADRIFDVATFKGPTTENLLAWTLLKPAVRKPAGGSIKLRKIFQPFFPPEFVWPHSFQGARASLSHSEICPSNPYPPLLDQNMFSHAILRSLPQAARTELIVPFDLEGELGLVCVHTKTGQDNVDLQDSLWSVSSGCQYYVAAGAEIKKLYETDKQHLPTDEKSSEKSEDCSGQKKTAKNDNGLKTKQTSETTVSRRIRERKSVGRRRRRRRKTSTPVSRRARSLGTSRRKARSRRKPLLTNAKCSSKRLRKTQPFNTAGSEHCFR